MTSSPAAPPCHSRGLPPVTGPDPRVLVLGSFPSVLSLSHGEYYGNPRNRFWAVIEDLFGISALLPYTERCQYLTGAGIALWDVIASCSRPGSADSRIRDAVPSDIAGFIRAHPTVRLIVLNGSAAGRFYHRAGEVPGIPFVILPSTSPANAAVSYKKKVRAWGVVKAACGRA
ncbi:MULTISPECIES: DNA-deoxyinosine glycosylase [unclassified Methanoregula]|uniref:DNA-deoxyinosine glycosylase n=1 Tax=unclassified Methanoregula TaxID=2649730 RepID=UPI0009D0330A|nr:MULTISPECIES: DNA-deoxyinosine glycosylase [unclassified Methanoregula]OPX64013.1 MAG: Uracil DNA glycosylase superfamily protein [Methanoregula sp. PtaB.Bin085]OPY33789.1 MAG: Uracil DNA glycosylase superfamily protein [Methanoregula sp. PtaU1.Bin006]